MNKILDTVLFFLLLFLVVAPTKAYAYLDPGTGSYLIQVMAAALFGGLFAIKMGWGHIKSFFQSLVGRKDKKTSEKGSSNNK